MSKYIFIAMNICNIGGSEQYLYNKTTFLEKQGHDCYVISGMRGKIMIAGLAKYKSMIIPNVMYPPCLFTKKERLRTIDKITRIIHFSPDDNCIIESDGIDEAKWGELLACRYNGRHIVLNVQEVHDYSKDEIKFLRFKYDRQELAGITDRSVNMMLKDDLLTPHSWSKFSAYCNNVVDDVPNTVSDKFDTDNALTIGSIGRLEKPFVIPMLKLLSRFFKEHPDKRYNLVLIGGTSQKSVRKKISDIVTQCNNVKLIITGLMYPIPRDLIKNIDVFISTSGAADVTYLEHKPTIKVHPVTGEPAGVIGYNFIPEVDSMFNPVPGKTILDYLKDILDNKISIKYTGDDQYVKYKNTMHAEFARQLKLAMNSVGNQYYDTSDIEKKGFKYKIYALLGKSLGGENMQTIMDILRKIK